MFPWPESVGFFDGERLPHELMGHCFPLFSLSAIPTPGWGQYQRGFGSRCQTWFVQTGTDLTMADSD
jgi:hypothetical protein